MKNKGLNPDMMYTWEEFEQRLMTYRDTCIDISRIVSTYEQRIKELVCSIQQLSYEKAHPIFDELYELQGHLASASYAYDIKLSPELDIFVYHFDRADDEYIRQYWYKQFHAGVTWPLPKDDLS